MEAVRLCFFIDANLLKFDSNFANLSLESFELHNQKIFKFWILENLN